MCHIRVYVSCLAFLSAAVVILKAMWNTWHNYEILEGNPTLIRLYEQEINLHSRATEIVGFTIRVTVVILINTMTHHRLWSYIDIFMLF